MRNEKEDYSDNYSDNPDLADDVRNVGRLLDRIPVCMANVRPASRALGFTDLYRDGSRYRNCMVVVYTGEHERR